MPVASSRNHATIPAMNLSTKPGPPRIVTIDGGHPDSCVSTYFRTMPSDMVLAGGMPDDKALKIFKDADCVFSDADGIVVDEGKTVFPTLYAGYVRQLADIGVTFILITGKPYEEVCEVAASLPKGTTMKIIYEKGAYILEPDESGIMRKHYLLTTPQLEASVRELRRQFVVDKSAIESKYLTKSGQPAITLGWSGSGRHQSIISIDILAGTPPENYMDITGVQREELKVKDPVLLERVEADLQSFVDKHRSGWQLVHVGNANSDITPGPIEKDIAIEMMPEYHCAKSVLL